MKPPDSQDSKQNAPWKWVLVIVLACILGFVLYSPSEPDAEDDVEPPSAASSGQRTTLTETTPRSQQPQNEQPAARSWTDVQIDELLTFDPFALSTELDLYLHPQKFAGKSTAESAADARSAEEIANLRRKRLESALADLMSKKISAVFTGKKGKSALIGSKWVEEGDVLDGLRIVEIDGDGVTVEIGDEP